MTAKRTKADVHQDIDAAQEEFKQLTLFGLWVQVQEKYYAKIMPIR